jgi:hypothetical protein
LGLAVLLASCADPSAAELAPPAVPRVAIAPGIEGDLTPGATLFQTTLPHAQLRFADGRLAWSRGGSEIALETTFVGRGEAAESPAAPTRTEERGVAIDHGIAVEHLRVVEGGVQQTFRFDAQPPGDGALEVHVRVDGAEHTGETDTGHHFASATGLELDFGVATFVDANGRRTPLATEIDARGELTIRVEASTLATAVWPADIDPLISTRANLVDPVLGYSFAAQESDIAFDGSNYLVVWHEYRDIAGRVDAIRGARVTPAGVVLDPGGFVVFENPTSSTVLPTVAFDGTNFVSAAYTSVNNLRFNRITPDGVVLDGPTGRSLGTLTASAPVRVAAGGGVSLLVWSIGGVRARLIDATGTPVSAAISLTTTTSDSAPSVTFDGTQFVVAWRRGSTALAGPVVMARVGITGAVVDTTPVMVGTARADWASIAITSTAGTSALFWRGTTGAMVLARVDGAATLLDATPLVLSGTALLQGTDVATDGTTFQASWLANGGTGIYSVVVNRVALDGTVLDGTGAVVVAPRPTETTSASACSPTSCFVTWTGGFDIDATGYGDLFGMRVAAGAALDSAPTIVSIAASRQWNPIVTRGASQYLVVWEDYRSGFDTQIWGARVALDGTVLDPSGFPICTAVDDQSQPTVTAASSGDFFVAWQDLRSPTTTYEDIYGTLVRADGTVVIPDGTRFTTSTTAETASVASDGTSFILVWHDAGSTTNNPVSFERIASDGIAFGARSTLAAVGHAPTATFGGGNYMVAYDDGGSILATRITPSGIVLDSTRISPGAGTFATTASDDTQYLIGFRRYDSAASAYRMYASRIALDGTVRDPIPLQLTISPVGGFGSTPWRQAPQATFDGADFELVWGGAWSGGSISAAWVSPGGRVFGTTTLVSVPASIALGWAVAGEGDGDHAMLVYTYGDSSPGIRNHRVTAQRVTFRTDGHACTPLLVGECKSGFCIDGVCCDTSCGGGVDDCQACAVARGASTDGACAPLSAGTVCRPSSGRPCDRTDTCDGTSVLCTDVLASAATVCRAVAGDCDREERCTGASADCPADVLEPVTTVCRGPSGVCDTAERCSGTTALCPPDAFALAMLECRASAGLCDLPEHCSGAAADCPADLTSPNGASCANATVCDGDEVCAAGACTSGTPPTCDDGDACTADACDAVAGCSASLIAGCCRDDFDCDDGDVCTADTCSGLGGSCTHAVLPACMDAAGPDAGSMRGDGGSLLDGGAVMDAAGMLDGATTVDAGSVDASGSVDAATAADGATPQDAAPSDATTPRDGATGDAGDASGARDATVAPAEATGGCGCHAAGASQPGAPGVWLALAITWLATRRRARAGSGR